MIPDCTAFWQELQGYLTRINNTLFVNSSFNEEELTVVGNQST
jgi:hypothetical protein